MKDKASDRMVVGSDLAHLPEQKLPAPDSSIFAVDFSRLSEMERVAMEMRLDGFTYQEIADKLSIDADTVGPLLRNARKLMGGRRTKLGATGPEYPAGPNE